MDKLTQRLDMLVVEADFEQAITSLREAELELEQTFIQQLEATTQYNAMVPITDRVLRENLSN